ncbi:hypothetical protein Tco_0128276 [Tanacetum coccineum]
MDQENYVEGCSMKRPPLLEPNGFCIWKARFETYVKAKVTTIEESKYLATLPLDELIGNLKVYEMVLDNDGVASKTINEKVKTLALKAKVTREQTSDDSDSQDGSDEDVDEEEEAEAFNLMARNFRKFFRKGNQFERGNRFGNGGNRFGKGHGNSFGNNDGENLYNYKIEGHFSIKCRKLKKNKAFVGGAWSNSEDGDDHQNKATCLMAIDSQKIVSKPSSSNYDLNIIDLPKENEELLSKINDLEIEVKKLANDKEVIEPCKKYEVLTKEVDSLKCNFSKLPDEALNFSKFKESSIALDDMLSHQKLSQDKEGLGFSKNYKIAFESLNVTFDESLPEPKSSPKSVKEARGHPIEQVIGIPLKSWEKNQLHPYLKAWADVLLSNVFVEIVAQESLPVIVGYMYYCIKTNTPFNFAYFIAKRLSGLDYNNEALPYARIMTTLFKYLKNKHPNDASRMIKVEEVSPMSSAFTMESLKL